VWEFFMSVSSAGVSSVGPAAARALRKTGGLADEAPLGRLFAAIATLVDASRAVEAGLIAADMPRAASALAALDLASDSGHGFPGRRTA
jgi:hypothetical protein